MGSCIVWWKHSQSRESAKLLGMVLVSLKPLCLKLVVLLQHVSMIEQRHCLAWNARKALIVFTERNQIEREREMTLSLREIICPDDLRHMLVPSGEEIIRPWSLID